MTDTPSDDDLKNTVEARVDAFVRVRARIKELDAEHDAKMKPIKDLQNDLTAWLMEFFDKTKSTGIKTKMGTAYTSTRYSASLPDAEAFMEFVKTTGAWDLMDRKANSTAVKDYVTKNGKLPPGVNLAAIRTLGVNTSGSKKND